MKTFQLTSLAIALSVSQIATANETARQDTAQPGQIEQMEVTGSRTSGYAPDQASVAGRLPVSVADTPQSISILSSDLMQDFQLTNINSALDTATGIDVQRIESDRTYYTARGFEINNFQIDGIGLPLSSGNTHGNIETAIYDQIEVVRGANGLMTGAGNPSATVNLARKRPADLADGAIAITGGSWDRQRIEVDGMFPIGDSVRARVVVVDQSSESYLDRYSDEKTVFYGVVEADLTRNTQLTLGHTYSDSSADGNLWGALTLYYTDGTPTNFDRSTNTAADWSNWNIVKENTFVELTHAFNEDWQATAIYSHITTDEDSELFYVYGTPDRETGLGLIGYASEYDLDDRHDLFDVYVTGAFDLLGREHQIATGASFAEMAYEDISLYDYSTGNGFPPLPAMEQWHGNTPFPVLREGASGSEIEEKQTAYYASGRFNILDGWHIIAGGRYNQLEVDGVSYATDQTSDDDEFIPYLGTVYELVPGIKAYASYTETFMPQTELDINNFRLDPVTGESAELGVKAELFSGRLLATAAYFDVQQTNLAKLDPSTASLPADQQRYIGADGVSSNGYELELAGELISGLQASVGFTSFDIKGDDLIAGYTPDSVLKLSTTYNPAALSALTIGANLRWQDDISRVQGVVGEGFAKAGDNIVTRQDAYTIVNLMARYDFTDKLSLQVNANNVTDEKYLNSLFWAQGYYGAPANYSATLMWKI
ncbi:TonB-dependent siderophore receptor [Gilvimarinus sp. SDUM040013]|uniref:TonB-dependent siderophore receptor n=1 Tax=Gilvimarinus gilvus TaxID=3058038 RepID=A0ABU4S0Y9_9GAMM|nr:TonB-dependent siderophore receptor [Gilvimarinus sp. SDUM040013]MDO3384827.1 TonB-dependent siderophore receptor [Gilvimarinus sp. SDUM040013]MDX6850840.1 TonB-dependent siderophore receptor [Gilvimarinus sp. SDUM040013]